MILGNSVWCSKLYLPCMDGGTCVYMQEAHVHAGTEEVLCLLDQDQWRLYLMGWNELDTPA